LVETTDSSPPPSLRIALVCPFSLSRPGGVQGQVLGLARALPELGHKATVFAPLDDAGDAPDGIELVATGHSVSLPSNGSIAPVTLSVRAVRRALHELQSSGFDVVHVHEPFTPGLPYGLLLGRNVPPLVATFHRSGGSPLYRVLGPLARRSAHRLVVRAAVSEAARATASDALGGTYEVGFNGVEVDQYQGVEPWPTGRPTLLFLGRHEERKGLRTLLDAFEELRRDLPDPTADATRSRSGRPVLWIAGDGPLTKSLRRLHPPSADIEWLGVLPEGEKVRRLIAADAVCAPSLGGESFGMVLLEAMAARTVVVASDIEGYRAAAGGHAVLTPPADQWTLADALTRVLEGRLAVLGDPGTVRGPARERWLEAAASRADQWSMVRLAQWYEGLYHTAMVRPRA
jgi:phosphatidylinositol alpha-mannosyltransferase